MFKIFDQISTACGPNIYQIMYVETFDFQCQRQNSNTKCLIGKSIFTVNLPLKLFRTTVANAHTRILKFPHTLFDTYLNHVLGKFEPNRMVQTVQNFKHFDKKRIFIFTKL